MYVCMLYIHGDIDNNDCKSQLLGFKGCKNVNMKKIHKCGLVVYYSNYFILIKCVPSIYIIYIEYSVPIHILQRY